MPVDQRSAYLKLPLPHEANRLDQDLPRLRTAFNSLDAYAQRADAALAGLDSELESKSDELAARSSALEARSTTLEVQGDELRKACEKTATDVLDHLKAENPHHIPLAGTGHPGLVQPDNATCAVDAAGIMSVLPNEMIETWRKSWIGVPRYWRSDVLPVDHCWANGDLMLFADWPELKEVYDNNGFAGMLLAYDADAAAQAANLGKWRPNSANPTGLYTPNLSNQFFRNWTLGLEKSAGAWGRDECRNAEGRFGVFPDGTVIQGYHHTGDGVWTPDYSKKVTVGYNNDFPSGVYPCPKFSLSNAIPTGPMNVPPHVWQPIILYLGRPR